MHPKQAFLASTFQPLSRALAHPTPEHKREAVQKLEQFNVDQVFALYEGRSGSPQKSPQ